MMPARVNTVAPTGSPRAARGRSRHAEKRDFRPDIEGLRAVAVVAVVLFHAAVPGVTGGFVGVDVFFVLSGFLITNLLVEEWNRLGRVEIGRFYLRRVLRLAPAMLCVLAFVWGAALAEGGLGTTPTAMARFTLLVLSYTNNWASALHSTSVPAPLGHFWSLAVEEQFYLVWPWLLVVAFRSRVSLRALLVTLLASVAVLSLWRTMLWEINHDPFRGVFGTDTRATGLLIGSAIAVARHVGLRTSRSFATVLVGAGMLLYALIIPRPYDLAGWLLLGGLQPVELAACMLIIGLTASPGVPFASLLEAPPCLWLGRRSYAIYLWNWPLSLLARAILPTAPLLSSAVAVVCTFVAAELSYRYLELPVLRLRATIAANAARAPLLAAA